MSKKEKKTKVKKNHWIRNFMLYAIVMVVIMSFVGKSNSTLPNIIAIFYVLSGIVWFYLHLRLKKEESK